MKAIDYFLDRISMYRLVLYVLIILLCVAAFFGFAGLLPFSPIGIIALTGILLGSCYATNYVFSHVFQAPVNIESVYITALILALIIKPEISAHAIVFWLFAGVLSMASKYILAIHRKHIFNPVAIAVVLTSFGFGSAASWWVGTSIMMPFVLIGGILIVRKIRRFELVFWFFLTALVTILSFTIARHGNVVHTLTNTFIHSSLLFFAFLMLTEPLTTPPTKRLQSLYGAFIGFIFVPQVHIGTFYFAPEFALIVGNALSYIVSPKQKFFLYLKNKIQVTPDSIDFLFQPKHRLAFTPGQYMEWTLAHPHADSRGNRRYFTIASSPTEDTLRLGVKFVENGSTFKKAMRKMDSSKMIVGSQLAGDFVLPKDKQKKLVFIAGGIGVTPFRSMLKYLVDIKQKRDIVLFYSNPTYEEIVYGDVFDAAEMQLGINTIYTLTDKDSVPSNWSGRVGRFSDSMLKEEVPDFLDRTYYLSGPFPMVNGCETVLLKLGVKPTQIKKDFFPGLV